MDRKIVYVVALVCVLGLTAAGYGIAARPMWNTDDPEATKYGQMLRSGKLSAEDLKGLESERNAREAWLKLTPEERQQAIKEGGQKFMEDEKKRAQQGSELPAVETGILKDGVDAVYPGAVFIQQTPAWRGYIGGVLYTAVSGAPRANPEQGTLVLFETYLNPVNYHTPTAAGPVEIVSEQNGVLVLKSLAGKWEAYDSDTNAHKMFETKGGITYRFDLKSRTFK